MLQRQRNLKIYSFPLSYSYRKNICYLHFPPIFYTIEIIHKDLAFSSLSNHVNLLRQIFYLQKKEKKKTQKRDRKKRRHRRSTSICLTSRQRSAKLFDLVFKRFTCCNPGLAPHTFAHGSIVRTLCLNESVRRVYERVIAVTKTICQFASFC